MVEKKKLLLTEKEGRERSRVSCLRAKTMLAKRPWVTGEIIETVQNSRYDCWGIDMYVPLDTRLTDLLCMKQERRGIKVQVKSASKKEHEFWRERKKYILNLAKGENIFILNGQDEYPMMVASLLGQMMAMASLTGSIPEEVLMGFIAEDLNDQEAVLAYMEHRDVLIRDRWFKGWLDGSKFAYENN
jgi:hypothetical protein